MRPDRHLAVVPLLLFGSCAGAFLHPLSVSPSFLSPSLRPARQAASSQIAEQTFRTGLFRLSLSSDVSPTSVSNSTLSSSPSPTLSLNGQRILPTKVLVGGLAAHSEPIAAVYAILNRSYRRGTDGWDAVEHVGSTSDLAKTIERHVQECEDSSRVAHVRALSFTFPDPKAMQTVARQWSEQAVSADAPLDQVPWSGNSLEFLLDDDDDEEEDDDDEDVDDWPEAFETAPSGAVDEEEMVVSPFAETAPAHENDSSSPLTDGRLPLTEENIDRVLEEVRPYLIADGGNVAVSRLDAERKVVYLRLEGACGSCPSSTVTMKMGIERVLKEHFDVDQILQEEDSNKPTELTWEAVEVEVNRIRPAIMAMGGVCDLVGVDAATGVVKIQFRGFNKVQQGLELAIRGLPFVNAVQFVTGAEE